MDGDELAQAQPATRHSACNHPIGRPQIVGPAAYSDGLLSLSADDRREAPRRISRQRQTSNDGRPPGEWSVLELVGHLSIGDRRVWTIRWTISQDETALLGYDQELWVARSAPQ